VCSVYTYNHVTCEILLERIELRTSSIWYGIYTRTVSVHARDHVSSSAREPHATTCLEEGRGGGAAHAAGGVERVDAEQLVEQAAGIEKASLTVDYKRIQLDMILNDEARYHWRGV